MIFIIKKHTMKKIWIVYLCLLVIFSCKGENESPGVDKKQGLSSAVQALDQITQVVGIGKIEPETQILSLASSGGGIITDILKREGDRIRSGEAIIMLDSETERNNVELIKGRIKTQEYQAELNRGAVRETEIRLASAVRLLESSRRLLKDGAETVRNLDDLETEVSLLETTLIKDRANLGISESKISELRTELQLARLELSRRTLTSPADGTVLNIMVTLGSPVSPFAEFCEFAPDGRKIARCEVDEMFADRVREGQDASITRMGTTEVIARGSVIRAAPFLKSKSLFSELPGDREDRRVREVWILLDEGSNLLYNLRVECIINI